MPQRQDTQGDFGLRPTKVTQGIVDSYHAPSIPKPDLSSLKALAGLSKTAAGLLQEHRKTEARHHEEGVAFGEANPDAELQPEENISIFGVETPFKRGTTEAAMAGFQKGRGRALQATFRMDVLGEWATMLEADEDMRLRPELFGQFLQEREAAFVQEHGLDGLSLSTFGLGRGDWMVDEMHKNNLSSVKFQKDMFKADMADVTSSGLAGFKELAHIAETKTSTDVMDYFRVEDAGLEDARMLTMPDGSEKAASTLTEEDLADPRTRDIADEAIKRDMIASDVLPAIQGVLQEGHDVGGETEREVRRAVVADLIASLSEGQNPEETWILLDSLSVGTGLLRDTAQFRAAYAENQDDIEANRARRLRSYTDNLRLNTLHLMVAQNPTQAVLSSAVAEVRGAVDSGYLTEDEGVAYETKLYSSYDGGKASSDDDELRRVYVGLALGSDTPDGDYNSLSAEQLSDVLAQNGHKVSPKDLRYNVSEVITASALQQYPHDGAKRAQLEVESIQRNALFATDLPNSLSNRINFGGRKGTMFRDPKDLSSVLEGYHLYAASKHLLGGVVRDEVRNYYEYIGLQKQAGLTLEDAVDKARSLGNVWGSTPSTQVSAEEVADYLDDAMPVVQNMALGLANTILREGGISAEAAMDDALRLLEDSNIGSLGTGPNERVFRRSGTNRTFDDQVHKYEQAIVANLNAQWASEAAAIDKIAEELRATPGYDADALVAASSEYFEKSGLEKVGYWTISGVLRSEDEKRYIAAVQVFTERNDGVPPMVAQSAFTGAELGTPTPNIGITSTMEEAPTYSVRNLTTSRSVDYYNGQAVPTGMSPEQMVKMFDAASNEYDVATRQSREAFEKHRRSREHGMHSTDHR